MQSKGGYDESAANDKLSEVDQQLHHGDDNNSTDANNAKYSSPNEITITLNNDDS